MPNPRSRLYNEFALNVRRETCMRFLRSLLMIATVFVTACEPQAEDPFARHFVIRKGDHYSTPRLVQMLQSDRLSFRATFNQTAIYDLGDPALQSNKNKLMGFSDCNSMHHENSARFAWQWFNDRLEIYAYCYVNSERKEAFIATVNLNEENLYEIKKTDDAYVFYLNGKAATTVKRNNTCDKGIYYMLFPYFGGAIPAPHNVQIDVRIL